MARRLSDVQETNYESKVLYSFLERFGKDISLLRWILLPAAGLLIRGTRVDWQQRLALMV